MTLSDIQQFADQVLGFLFPERFPTQANSRCIDRFMPNDWLSLAPAEFGAFVDVARILDRLLTTISSNGVVDEWTTSTTADTAKIGSIHVSVSNDPIVPSHITPSCLNYQFVFRLHHVALNIPAFRNPSTSKNHQEAINLMLSLLSDLPGSSHTPLVAKLRTQATWFEIMRNHTGHIDVHPAGRVTIHTDPDCGRIVEIDQRQTTGVQLATKLERLLPDWIIWETNSEPARESLDDDETLTIVVEGGESETLKYVEDIPF